MSINPISDLVLDVAKAADPVKSAEATARLARLAESEGGSRADFESILQAKPHEALDPSSRIALVGAGRARARAPHDARATAVEGIEQLVLQKLVESMLPKDTGTLFGRGTAGDVWRSMLAQQLAAEIGSVIDLGIGRAMPWVSRGEAPHSRQEAHGLPDRAAEHGS